MSSVETRMRVLGEARESESDISWVHIRSCNQVSYWLRYVEFVYISLRERRTYWYVTNKPFGRFRAFININISIKKKKKKREENIYIYVIMNMCFEKKNVLSRYDMDRPYQIFLTPNLKRFCYLYVLPSLLIVTLLFFSCKRHKCTWVKVDSLRKRLHYS